MNTREASRGQPLVVLATILGAWLVGRVLLWAPPYPLPEAMPATLAHSDRQDAGATIATASSKRRPEPGVSRGDLRIADVSHGSMPAPSQLGLAAIAHPTRFDGRATGPTSGPAAPIAHRATGHQMLLAAAFASRNLPPELLPAKAATRGHAIYIPTGVTSAVADRPLLGPARSETRQERRLSGDAWALWREGSTAPAAPGISAYGRSQAGAVLRYRLLPDRSLRPTAYARVSRTLEGPRQSEIAAGISLRPLTPVPVSVAAEARVSDTAAGHEVRPAAFAVTQLPPASLPLDLRGEAYVQAGYVGGRFATAFIDGQARVDRRVIRLGGENELRAGVGAWGGAQKQAARLDIGPTASVALRLGEARARIAVDYRLRVAGHAAPASGPAVTFSAGF